MGPPIGRMPRVDCGVRSSISPSPNKPAQPFLIPLTLRLRVKARRATARIAALRPGASPPPVRTPMRIPTILKGVTQLTPADLAEHDPGVEVAARRAAAVPPVPGPIRVPGAGEIRVGTASWTDPTMTAAGVFYPPEANNAEERLRYYASQFPIVEVDASYYAIPAAETARLWADRTPPGFMFDIKAHALIPGQPAAGNRLPEASREPRGVQQRRDLAARVRQRDDARRHVTERLGAHGVEGEYDLPFAGRATLSLPLARGGVGDLGPG